MSQPVFNVRYSRRATRSAFVAAIAALALAAGAALAATPADLYSAQVSLPRLEDADPQAEEERRNDAYARALAQVLVRVTGQRGIGAQPEAAPLLDAAQQFVQQFTTRPADDGRERLWVAFDGDAVERAAASVGLPVWNRDRPAVLMWLAVDRGDGRRNLLGADSADPVKVLIEDTARERGVPLIWPLLDSADRAAASAADVWGGFGERVTAASARYRSDVVVVARLRSRPGSGAFGSFDVRTGAEDNRWRAGAAQGMHQLADYLVSRLAASSDVASVTSITVSNVYSVSAYSDVVNYLERLTLIERVRLRAVQDDTLVFEADVRGDAARLRRAIDVGRMLVSDAGDGLGLSFRYAQ